MKITTKIFPTIFFASAISLLTGCGKSTPVVSNAPGREIVITADDKMKFDVTEITANPGERLSVTLKDTGTAPKFSMGHNFTLLQKNTNVAKFIEGGAQYASANYVAPEDKSKVLAQTKLLGPGESDTVNFNVPQVPDQYDFVCTFPGHYAVGMKGKLIVAP